MRTLSALLLALTLAACDALPGGASTATVRYVVDGPATITYATPGAVGQATTSGPWQTTVALSGDTPAVLTATSATGTPVTAQIFKDDDLVGARRGRSVRVESSSSSSSSSQGEIEVKGPIEALSADRVTVLGLTFALDGQTRLEDDDDRPVTLAAFAVGTYVEVEGRRQSDGTLRARKMEIDDDDDDLSGGQVEVDGRLTAIDAESMTVSGIRFITTPSTRYEDDDDRPISRSAFRVGDEVEAEGRRQSDGTIIATEIELDD